VPLSDGLDTRLCKTLDPRLPSPITLEVTDTVKLRFLKRCYDDETKTAHRR